VKIIDFEKLEGKVKELEWQLQDVTYKRN